MHSYCPGVHWPCAATTDTNDIREAMKKSFIVIFFGEIPEAEEPDHCVHLVNLMMMDFLSIAVIIGRQRLARPASRPDAPPPPMRPCIYGSLEAPLVKQMLTLLKASVP